MLKKAQAAMEFLRDYGWAILVILAAISALGYFDVLDPERFLPENCMMPSGIRCMDYTASASSVGLVIQNVAGFDMNSVAVSVNGTTESAGCVDADGDATLMDGEQDTFTCTPAAPFSAGKFRADIYMRYDNAQTSMSHSKKGKIIVNIE